MVVRLIRPLIKSTIRYAQIGFYTVFGVETYRELSKYKSSPESFKLEEVGPIGKALTIVDKSWFSFTEQVYVLINNLSFSLKLPIYVISWSLVIITVLILIFIVKRYIKFLVWLSPYYLNLKKARENFLEERDKLNGKVDSTEEKLKEVSRENEFMKEHIEKLSSKLDRMSGKK